MQRITVTLDDRLVAHVRTEVERGRAPSVSAWVADAVGQKARAMEDLDAYLAKWEAEDPYTDEDVEWVSRAVGRSRAWAEEQLGARR